MKPYGTSIYYASDRIIKDALCQHKISIPEISRLFLRRGIIVSHESSREDLALYFSSLSYDYYDQERISDALGFVPRRDRTTSRVIQGAKGLSELESALRQIRPKIEEIGDKMDITVAGNALTADLEYSHVDYRRSELTQVRHEQGSIEILSNGDKLFIRHTHNPYISNIVESAISAVSVEDPNSLSVETINLQTITAHKKRSEFFDLLASEMNGLSIDDVSAAYVFKKYAGDLMQDDGDDDDDDLDDTDVRIDKATLKGRKVQNAEELKHLYDRGFYCVRRIWMAKEVESGLRYTLDASFSEPEGCTGFSYLLRRVHEDQGEGRPPRQRAPIKSEINRIYSLIETAARSALEKLGQGVSNDPV